MKSIDDKTPVYLYTGVTDMRAGAERLTSLVMEKLTLSVISSCAYFMFLSRCRKRVRILYWDRDGYALWSKRLSAGAYRVAKSDGYEVITAVDVSEILSGIDYARIKLQKNAEKGLYLAG